jgi:glycosyltransferase involved in cell wall biosynthesis
MIPDRQEPGERQWRILDLISTDKSAKELLDHRVAQVNATGRYQNAIYCSSGEYVDRLRAKGHTVHVVDTPRGLSPLQVLIAAWRTFRLFRKYQFDAIHTHGAVVTLIGNMMAALTRVPVVVFQIHGFHHHKDMGVIGRRLCILSEKILSASADVVLFQNQVEMKDTIQRRIAPERKLVLVGNGIQLGVFRPGPPPQNDPPVILSVARFEAIKNHGLLLKAARVLKERGVKFAMHLAGDGEARPDCEAWVRDHGLSGTVHFLGYRDDIPGLTAGAEVCLLASVKEGTPRAIIEAAACGRPTVATDVVGSREAVVDGVTGFLVPLDDAAAMADRVQRLLADASLRETMGNQARALAESRFDEREVTQRIIEVYDKALLCRKPRGEGQ